MDSSVIRRSLRLIITLMKWFIDGLMSTVIPLPRKVFDKQQRTQRVGNYFFPVYYFWVIKIK